VPITFPNKANRSRRIRAGSAHRHRRPGLALSTARQEAASGHSGLGRFRHGGHGMSHGRQRRYARRAALDGIPTAGKTGTTNAYRDACSSDIPATSPAPSVRQRRLFADQPDDRRSLPAQTWHDIMVRGASGASRSRDRGYWNGHEVAHARCFPTIAANARQKPPESSGTAADPDQRGADIWCGWKKMLD